jgi:hypothetical protein
MFHIIYLQFPPFKISHIDQKVSALLLPMAPRSKSRRPQKYITSPLKLSCIVSSKTPSASADNATCFAKRILIKQQIGAIRVKMKQK